MTLDELENKLNALPDRILSDAAEIVAETAVESFKDNFRKKGYDGNPWTPAKKIKRTGSLLIQSGALLNSIRPHYVGTDKVVIAAGGDKVTYAKVHNEGFSGQVAIPAHTRKTKKYGNVPVRAHTKNARIPQRQFMGRSREALEKIAERLKGYLASLKHV